MNKLLLLILTSFLFISCSSDVQDINDIAANSSFEVSPISSSNSQYITHDVWKNIPTHKSYDLKICLTDMATLNNISGEKFTISSSFGSITRKTSSDGCIYWTESISFDFFAQEKWIGTEYTINGEGHYPGNIRIPVAFNFWSSQADFKDLVHHDLGSHKAAPVSDIEIDSFKMSSKHFITNNIRIIRKGREDNTLSFQLKMDYLFRRVDLVGKTKELKVSNGEFDIDLFLVEKDRQTFKREVLATTSISGEVGYDGTLSKDFSFSLYKTPGLNNKLELAYRVSPVNPIKGMGHDEGFIPISSLNDDISSKPLHIKNSLSDELRLNELPLKIDIPAESLGFNVDTLQLRKTTHVGEMFGEGSTRKINAELKACLVDSITRESIKDTKFGIKLFNDEGLEVYSKNGVNLDYQDGCLRETILIDYNALACRNYETYTLKITGESSPYADIESSRIMHINPWAKSDSTFFIDGKIRSDAPVSKDTCPKLLVDSINYEYTGNQDSNFIINDSLNLLMGKSIEIEIQPKVIFGHNFEGEELPESLLHGDYVIKAEFYTPKRPQSSFNETIDMTDYIKVSETAHEFALRQSGSAHVELVFPMYFAELPILAKRNLMVLHINSKDKNSTLIGSSRAYPINILAHPKSKTYGRHIIIDKNNDHISKDTEYKRAQLSDISKGKLSLDWFKKTLLEEKGLDTQFFNVTEVNNTVEQGFAITDFETIFQSGTESNIEVLSKLCGLLYEPAKIKVNQRGYTSRVGGKKYKACLEDPVTHFSLVQTKHIEEVTGAPVKVDGRTNGVLTQSRAYFISEGSRVLEDHGTREAHGLTATFGLEGGLSILPENPFGRLMLGGEIGVYRRMETFTTKSNANILSNLERMINDRAVKLGFESLKLEFPGKVRKCLLVKASPYEKKHIGRCSKSCIEQRKKGPNIIDPKRRVFLCKDDADIDDQITESWFFVAEKGVSPGILADTTKMGEGLLTTSVRGERNFRLFQKKFEDENQALILQSVERKDMGERFDSILESSNYLPGLIIPNN